ncbi:hypothetical protein K4K49_010015 [Colletotrichum sp. SAR 10_70]|nr:hypothetical protein K4K50_009217 [Colletotrichum sp. SAR 10_71]KAI8194112.1 hypothetical protein K4K49_010015 [Colletotrichum sp. SAR 10_70]KAI8214042.1 hypothetical protein K4K52_002764 [Colletotrichum sp. SAR 10_76]
MSIRKPKPWHYNEHDDAVPCDPAPNPYDHTKQEWRFRGDRCILRHEQAPEAGEGTAKSTVVGGLNKVACGAYTLGNCEVGTECPLSHTVRDDLIVAPKIAISTTKKKTMIREFPLARVTFSQGAVVEKMVLPSDQHWADAFPSTQGSKSITVDIMKAYELKPDIDSATGVMEKIHRVDYPAIRGILLRDFDVLVYPGIDSSANDNCRRQLNHAPNLPGYHDTSKMYSATYRC